MAINNVNNGLPKAPVDNNKVNSQQQPQQNKTAAQQAAASTAQAANVPRQDSVSLTQSAQQLNQVQKKSAEAPVNQEKVDKLKKPFKVVSTKWIHSHWRRRLHAWNRRFLDLSPEAINHDGNTE